MGSQSVCDACDVNDRALCCALPEIASASLHRIAHRRTFPKGKIVISQYQEPDWFAVIVTGVVKLVRTKRDGRQQIVGLQFPADFVGRPFGDLGSLMVEAATDLDLCCLSRKPFENLMQQHTVLERVLLQHTFDELDAARQWMFVLGRMSARAKVASFLCHVAKRTNRISGGGNVTTSQLCDLPLSRTETGEYLGLTIETVSRQIGRLKSDGIIETVGLRAMRILDISKLEEYAESEN